MAQPAASLQQQIEDLTRRLDIQSKELVELRDAIHKLSPKHHMCEECRQCEDDLYRHCNEAVEDLRRVVVYWTDDLQEQIDTLKERMEDTERIMRTEKEAGAGW